MVVPSVSQAGLGTATVIVDHLVCLALRQEKLRVIGAMTIRLFSVSEARRKMQ
jgi:hypothetical protein